MAATFILNESYSSQRNQVNGVNQPIDEDSLLKKLTHRIVEEQTNNSILNEIKMLSSRLDKMELEEAAEEEEEESNGIGGIDSNQIQQIMGLINLFKSQATKPVINGIDDHSNDVSNDFKNNINKALKILHKNDPLLDKDLMKLAELSEKNKDTFNMLLSTLRNM